MNWKLADRKIKKGRQFIGAIFTLSDGREIYVARRKSNKDIYYDRKANVNTSDAVSKGVAYWPVDEVTLRQLLNWKVELVAIHVEENGDLYVASIEDYMDRAKARILTEKTFFGARQKYLPFGCFKRRAGATRFK